jgi:diguanylate cyclase (GGDEF)-like protein
MAMRNKLILLFILIKIIPLIVLAWLVWLQADKLANALDHEYRKFSAVAKTALQETGNQAINDAVTALDERARNEMERIATDTSAAVAQFLYQRDADILYAATLQPGVQQYKNFVDGMQSALLQQGDWQLSQDQSSWHQVNTDVDLQPAAQSSLPENDNAFHARGKSTLTSALAPIYREITFVGLDGKERYKATTAGHINQQLVDVSERPNTFAKAETYFAHLKNLKAGEIYVSDVVGSYVPTKMIGTYTPKSADNKALDYTPEQSAYAGKENPKGQRFDGIVRWATPVVQDNEVVGYVTLALDHQHIRAFTDKVVPTTERYTNVPDASTGNYAFMWDYLGRNIAHPRHYFITGFDTDSGQVQMPWLEQTVYDDWQASGLDYAEFATQATPFRDQNLGRKPAKQMTGKEGLRGLDCRFLNFAPQCKGWFDLTENGGSGSFVIFWSGLWKLTTAASIPYYTGHYGDSLRGFGFVTVGANIDDFHAPAVASKERIADRIVTIDQQFDSILEHGVESIDDDMGKAFQYLTSSTGLMILAVIGVAIWMASYLSGRILYLIKGVKRLQGGDRRFRFASHGADEIDELADAFDVMSDQINDQVGQLEREITDKHKTEQALLIAQENLEFKVAERTKNLQQEVQDREAAELNARYYSEHDSLTGLYNRHRFMTGLLHVLSRKQKTSSSTTALLMVDLDKFKQVNDTLGHMIGDSLLCLVAKLFKQNVREHDLVARFGGDEFAILMTNLSSPEELDAVALRMVSTLSRPLSVDGKSIQIGVSIGIAVYNQISTDSESLFAHADVALYDAKAAGGSCYRHFQPPMLDALVRQQAIEEDLRNALPNNELALYYQPHFDYAADKVVSIEALWRWQHPTKGQLATVEFIREAEQCGVLPEWDKWTLEQACQQAVAWLREGREFGRMSVKVNAKELQQKGFATWIYGVLSNYELTGSHLEIEIIEKSLIENLSVVKSNLVQLREQGVSLVIGDFGVEYFSLHRLTDIAIDRIKIDPCFVAHIHHHKQRSIIQTLITMAHALHMEVVAGGVNSADQLSMLRASGCHVIQGDVYTKAMTAQELMASLDGLALED